MRRVLIVAYYFPPIGGIGSIRLAGFANHLPEFGWKPTVLAPRETPHARDDALLFPEERVIRSHSVEPSRIAALLRRGGAQGPVGSKRSAVRAAALRTLLYPDSQVGWYPGATLAGLRALRADSFDAIYSSSFPITAHLVARTLSRRGRLPWVAEFRDPWSDTLPPGRRRRRAAGLEATIARQAARVILPTPTWASYLSARWQAPVSVVPNGHDVGGSPASPPNDPVLTHLGSFYPDRQSLEALWKGLAALREGGQDPMPRVRFIGELDPAISAQASAAGVSELVEATGFVPHQRAMDLLGQSSMLFASGGIGAGPVDRGWIPAKLFEYVATALPILYLGDSHSDAAALLRGHEGCHVVEHADSEGVTRALRAGLGGARHTREASQLSRRAAAKVLAGCLDEAAGPAG